MDKFKGSLCQAVKLFLKSQGKIRPAGDENGNENLCREWESLSTGMEVKDGCSVVQSSGRLSSPLFLPQWAV